MKLAIVLVRGAVGLTQPVKDTLHTLRLGRKNFCVIVPDTPAYRGMIQKVKDMVTWGEISEEMFEELVKVRGEPFLSRTTDAKKKYSYAVLEHKGKKYKPYFRLNPPRKGFGRKGIKMAFVAGGALGYRKEKMDDLIKRML
ncbi:uL30 family ribosomal protein [Candidatus Woesearchaeota archaeon]|nr:uL30 family ribosomal protein [Candidatus Woesearchaeota archaeon]